MRDRHFLVLNPSWSLRDDIERHAAAVAQAADLAPYDVRHRLLKPGVSLIAKGDDPETLKATCARLREEGYKAVVVTEEELRTSPRPGRAVSMRREGDSIELLDREYRPVMRVDRDSKLLVVAGDLDVRKEAVVRSLLDGRHEGGSQRLKAILRGRTVLRLFDATGGPGAFVKDRGFRFPSMGKAAGLSVTHNMRVLLDQLVESAGEAYVDTDFGLADELPVNVRAPLADAEEGLVRLEGHALVTLAFWRAGVLARDEGSLHASGGGHRQAAPVPISPSVPSRDARMLGRLGLSHRSFDALREVGPPWLFVPLIAAAFGGLIGAWITESAPVLGVSGMSVGLMLFLNGFGNWKQKRLIEDYPTSKVRSIAMGKVEVIGAAIPRATLRTPYGGVDCVYYRYELQEFYRDTRGRTQWRTVARGTSGAIPFGVRDDTGEVLVLPDGARFDLSTRQMIPVGGGSSGIGVTSALVGGPGVTEKTRAIEEHIPTYGSVYVLGTARPIRPEPSDRRRELAMRLRALKSDRERLAEFDTNKDGRIDEGEWKAAVAAVESDMLEEKLSPDTDSADRVVIGSGDHGRLFLISDHSEEKLVRRLTRSSLIGVVFGLLLFGAGVWVAATNPAY